MRYIGVDLHKINFVVCFLTPEGESQIETFTLDRRGLASFKRKLKSEDKLAVEASANTFYFCRQINGCVSQIVVVDTYGLAVIARSKNKTDKKDAAMLAQFLKMGWLPAVPIAAEHIQQLRHLFQARESLVRMLTQLKNMGQAALVRSGYAYGRSAFKSQRSRARLLKLEQLSSADLPILEMSLRQMSQLESEKEQIESEIVERGKTLAGLKRLLQVHGLNLLASTGLLVEIGDIDLFSSSKQLVAYSGLATSVRQSNETVRRGKITKQGRKRLRTILIRAVLSKVNRTKRPVMDFYQ